jgi:hypothetical protein
LGFLKLPGILSIVRVAGLFFGVKMRDITLKLDSTRKDKHQITSQGFLVVDANLTRAGVFDYYDEDGKLIRELRSPEEVFSQESLDSMKFAPLTKFHPKEMVDAKNASRVQIGSIGENIVKRGDFVSGKVVINDKKEIDEILAKWDRGEEVELSMGYDAEVIDLAGEHHKDGAYQKAQTKIRYNHGSIVEKGRAGSNVKLIMDAEDEAIKLFDEKQSKLKKKTEGKKMFKFKKDSIEAGPFKMDSILEEVEDSAKGVVVMLGDKVDEAAIAILDTVKEKEELQAKHDELEESAKGLQAKVDELSSPTSATVQAMIKERADLEGTAAKLEVKTDGEDGKAKDSKTLKIDVIAKVHPEFKADEKTDVYIDARYDAVVEMLKVDKDGKSAASIAAFVKDADDKAGKEKKEPSEKFKENTKDYHKPKTD